MPLILIFRKILIPGNVRNRNKRSNREGVEY